MKSNKILYLLLVTVLLAIVFLSVETVLALSGSVNIKPVSYTLQSGNMVGDILALNVQDQTGTQNDSSKYVMFSTPSVISQGYFTYKFPSDILLTNMTRLQVKVNYKGPIPATQRWTWKLYDWKSGIWVQVGSNSGVTANVWKVLTFKASGYLARFVDSNGDIRVQLISNNAGKNAKIDMQFVKVTYQQSCGETVNSSFEDQVLDLINQERTSRGLTAFARDSRLDTAARLHSADMACSNYFDHNSLDGSTPWDRIHRQGYQYSSAAENIAAGYATPTDVVDGWMGSSGHKANILDPDLTQIGIGYAHTDSSKYGAYWTTDFASPAP